MLCHWCKDKGRSDCLINGIFTDELPCRPMKEPEPETTERKVVKALVGGCPTCHEERDLDLPCPYCGECE